MLDEDAAAVDQVRGNHLEEMNSNGYQDLWAKPKDKKEKNDGPKKKATKEEKKETAKRTRCRARNKIRHGRRR